MIPVSMLSSPLRHHERVVMIVLAAPTANSTTTVTITDAITPSAGAKKRYGATGTVAPAKYDPPTVSADLAGGSNDSLANPSSSRIITFAHRFSSEVICP